jgi:hypothetical protein
MVQQTPSSPPPLPSLDISGEFFFLKLQRIFVPGADNPDRVRERGEAWILYKG